MQVLHCVRRFVLAYRYPLLAFCLSRLTLLLVVYLGIVVVPLAAGEGMWRDFPGNLFLDGFGRWDSGWYLNIAEYGYSNAPLFKEQMNTAFFPAFPLLLSIVGFFGRQAMSLWGIIASNLFFCFALCFLFDIAKHFSGPRLGRLAVSLAAFSPFSIFFSAVYTESLFLATSTASFWLSIRGRLQWAMLLASIASVTKVVGILCVPFVLLSATLPAPVGSQECGKPRRLRLEIIIALSVGISLFSLYLIFLKVRFGNAFQLVVSQKAWATESGIAKLVGAWQPIFDLKNVLQGNIQVMGIINSASLAVAVALVAQCILKRWLPLSLSVWSLLTVLASSSLWFSGGRFVSAVFPLYIMLALCLRRLPAELSVGVSALLMSLFAIFFSHWYWVA